MSNDELIEQEIVAKGLNIAPRVTFDRVNSVIAEEVYFTAMQGAMCAGYDVRPDAPLRLLTFCVLILKNGYTVTGESACVSPENFNAEVGRKIARGHAVDKIWMLEGYLLRDELTREAK